MTNMESILNLDLKTFPDIADMLEGVAPGDVVNINASFQVKELSEKRFTGSFEDAKGITIKSDEEPESEDDSDEEDQPEEDAEESAG